MKKNYMFPAAILASAMLFASACGTQTPAPESVPTETSAVSDTANADTGSMTDAPDASEESSITGTLDEIKDFMFILTDDNGTSYVFGFEGEKPQGLDGMTAGDKVTVTYTGTLSEVDSFTGTIISIEKAE